MKSLILIPKITSNFKQLLFDIYSKNIKIGISRLEYSVIPSINVYIKKKYRKLGFGTAVLILLSDFVIINPNINQTIHILINTTKIPSLLKLFLTNNLIKYCGKGHYLYNHTILKSYLLRLYIFYRYRISFS
jgi:hypothetical protein